MTVYDAAEARLRQINQQMRELAAERVECYHRMADVTSRMMLEAERVKDESHCESR